MFPWLQLENLSICYKWEP